MGPLHKCELKIWLDCLLNTKEKTISQEEEDMNKEHFFYTVLLMVSVIMSGCGPSAEQAATMTAAAWTPTPPTTPTTQPISAEVRTEADQAFASGVMVYLYDPQPKTISIPQIEGTNFTVRYILPENSKEVPMIPLFSYVDLSGNKEIKMLWNPSAPDFNNKTGYITLSLLGSSMNNFYEQQYEQQGIEIKHVTPAFIEVVLVGLEQQGDITVIGSNEFSNTVRIDVTP
jgi:hypothetical protein